MAAGITQQQMNEYVEALASVTEILKPVHEWAEGQRQLLLSMGWTPDAAQAFALHALVQMSSMVFTNVAQATG